MHPRCLESLFRRLVTLRANKVAAQLGRKLDIKLDIERSCSFEQMIFYDHDTMGSGGQNMPMQELSRLLQACLCQD